MTRLRSYSADRVELTPRMVDVLRSAALGWNVDETARELHVSRGTVLSVRAVAISRLGARNIIHAVTIARERGWRL